MLKFFQALKWDFLLYFKYNIIYVAIILTLLYSISLSLFKASNNIIITAIFSDPVMMGFMFIGVMVLFEKSSNTLKAICVCPPEKWQYLLSKNISLTCITTCCSLIIAFATHGFQFNIIWFTLGVTLSSLLFVFIGFIVVTRVQTVNQYVMVMPLLFTPAAFPLITLFGVKDHWGLYLIPTQASLILMKGGFEQLPSWKLAYAIGFLLVSLFVAFLISNRCLEKYLQEAN